MKVIDKFKVDDFVYDIDDLDKGRGIVQEINKVRETIVVKFDSYNYPIIYGFHPDPLEIEGQCLVSESDYNIIVNSPLYKVMSEE